MPYDLPPKPRPKKKSSLVASPWELTTSDVAHYLEPVPVPLRRDPSTGQWVVDLPSDLQSSQTLVAPVPPNTFRYESHGESVSAAVSDNWRPVLVWVAAVGGAVAVAKHLADKNAEVRKQKIEANKEVALAKLAATTPKRRSSPSKKRKR